MIALKPLHLIAIKNFEAQISNEEIRKQDITEELGKELFLRRKRRNLINMQIRGEPTSGKSLIGYKFLKMIHRNIYKRTPKTWHIAADQIDFIDKVKDLKVGETAIQIDEWNELSTTGYNSTTSQALLTQINEVQAQRYIHKISCSPQKTIDHTATIIIDVIEKDEEKKRTHCHVLYVLHYNGIRIEQLCGHININVKKEIENKVWKAYRKRKFDRMKLLLKHGIIDSRKKDDSEIILKVVEKLQGLAKTGETVTKDLIGNYIEIVQDKYTTISMLGEEKLKNTISAILSYFKNITKTKTKIQATEKAIKKSETPEQKIYLKQIKRELENVKIDLIKGLEENLQKHENILNAVKNFENITEKEIKKGEKEAKGGILNDWKNTILVPNNSTNNRNNNTRKMDNKRDKRKKMSDSLFEIDIGKIFGKEKNKPKKELIETIKTYKYTKNQLLKYLQINTEPIYIHYDYKKEELIIKEKVEERW